MRILLVDDNPEIVDVLQKTLQPPYYALDSTPSPERAREMIAVEEYDLVVLDRRLAASDGLDLCRELRAAMIRVPILFLTVLNEPDERVRGLDAGGDDYLGKPFHIGELHARIRTLLRRFSPHVAAELQVADLRLFPSRHVVCRRGAIIDLLPKEFAILEYLMRYPGVVRTKEQITENIWGMDFDSRSNIVESYISRLRRKVEPQGTVPLIETVKGVGYRMRDIKSTTPVSATEVGDPECN